MSEKRKSRVWLWIVLAGLAVFLAFSMALNLALFAALSMKKPSLAWHHRGEDEYPHLVEKWSYGSGEVKAVRIALRGVITRQPEAGFLASRLDRVEAVLRQIRQARNDEAVRAILFEVDSPGGAISPSDEIYSALQNFKRSRKDRRVVMFTRDLSASGGYYAAMAADWIVAEPTAVIGSIGVIMQTLNWRVLSEKIGLTDVTMKSGKNKDLLNPFHDVSPEQKALLQQVIDRMYARFWDIVKRSRGFSDEQAAELADGRVFSAQDALDKGLIDQLGYWQDALEATKKLLGVSRIKVVRYVRQPSLSDFLSQVKLPWPDMTARETAPFLYLWRP